MEMLTEVRFWIHVSMWLIVTSFHGSVLCYSVMTRKSTNITVLKIALGLMLLCGISTLCSPMWWFI